jgi:2-amino-4-hydroxy-6-hydroxymethyldihydropteridine diphosphokinase
MNEVYLLLGSNEGDRLLWLQQGCQQINQLAGHIVQSSSLYETSAWGLQQQPDFINVVLIIHTTLTPNGLLEVIHTIEHNLGRQRKVLWGQRTLDIDILYFGHQVFQSPELQIPHPYISERRFTLVPLCEVAPKFVHPVLKKSNQQLLDECPDPLAVSLTPFTLSFSS